MMTDQPADASPIEPRSSADTVLITGCSSGIGLYCALAFARRGDRVHATVRRVARAGQLLDAAETENLELKVAQLDVTDDASVREAVAKVVDQEGGVDVLVNNAGIGGTARPVEELTDADWLAVLDTNLLGAVRTTRAVLPAMRSQHSGVIVNISSISGVLPGTPIKSPYDASKHALCSFSDSLATEVRSFGIRVACIEPGFVATPILDKSSFGVADNSPYAALAEAFERFNKTTISAAPDPTEVADCVIAAVHCPACDSIHQPVGHAAQMLVASFKTVPYHQFQALGRMAMGVE